MVSSHEELHARAKRLLAEAPDALREELDRVLARPERELGDALTEAARLAEMALVCRVDRWWAGSPQAAVRRAIRRLDLALADPLALDLGVRLALAWARLGRVDEDAHRLGRWTVRLVDADLPAPLDAWAVEVAAWFERAPFLASAEYAYELVRDLTPAGAFALANRHLARGNPSLAAQLVELRLVRALDDWYVGPSLPNVEGALAVWRAERPPELAELALLLARAYVQGGFVDLRARQHVLGVLEGPEAQLLGPEEAIGFREFVDRDCFDYPYAHLYELTRTLGPDALRETTRRHVVNGGLVVAARLCEMTLARRLDPWRLGDPAPNVRTAIDRWLSGEAQDDQDVAWAARVLAGLYAATLEGAPHARRLVGAVLAGPAAPELLETVAAAGIPEDVPLEELRRLYVESVEVEARVEAFRARAEAAGGLTEHERRAYEEVLRFLEEGEATPLGEVGRRLGDLVEVVAPEALLRSVAAVIEDALRLASGGAELVLRRERILAELARRDPALRSLDRLRTAPLEVLDEVAWSVTRENVLAAALEGLGCGLGGPTLALIDLPVLVLVNLNAVAAVATAYGFDTSRPEEREVAIGLLAGGPEALRRQLAPELSPAQALGGRPARDGLDDGRAGPGHLHLGARTALSLHAVAGRIAARLARTKLVQLVPILGGAVGAGLNFHFTQTTVRTAVMAYRYRWLVRRFELEGAGR